MTGAGVLVTVEVRTKPGRRRDALQWFARNLAIKVAIVLRLRRGPWPY